MKHGVNPPKSRFVSKLNRIVTGTRLASMKVEHDSGLQVKVGAIKMHSLHRARVSISNLIYSTDFCLGEFPIPCKPRGLGQTSPPM